MGIMPAQSVFRLTDTSIANTEKQRSSMTMKCILISIIYIKSLDTNTITFDSNNTAIERTPDTRSVKLAVCGLTEVTQILCYESLTNR